MDGNRTRLRVKKRPDLGVTGDSVSRWVTRARPKIDRIACPWLVRRFIDPRAEFFYVPTSEVFAFAEANNAVAYDIPGAPIEHDGTAVFVRQFPACVRAQRALRWNAWPLSFVAQTPTR
jgi:hypothetical protein